MNRKETISKLKTRHRILCTPIPKVHIRVFYRQDGSWHYSFGHKSFKYFVDNNIIWDENGNYNNEKMKYQKYCGQSGQDYTIKSLWYYIKKQTYHNNINELDLVKP